MVRETVHSGLGNSVLDSTVIGLAIEMMMIGLPLHECEF